MNGDRPPDGPAEVVAVCCPAPADSDSSEPNAKDQQPYRFEFATPPGHFVTRYIKYAAQRTDAPYDYHEAVALGLLAAATPRLRVYIAQYPRGLPTGMYLLLVGESTFWRKSTSLDFGVDILEIGCPDVLLSSRFASPEALVEELSTKSHGSAVYISQEFGEQMDAINKRPHLAGFAGLLCELFDGRDYQYRRTTKRRRDGTPVPDFIRIENCSFVVLAAATPASIFRRISFADVGLGVWPRFAIIWPDKKPPRMPFHQRLLLGQEAQKLAAWLAEIKDWANQCSGAAFTERALTEADHFIAQIEKRAEELAPRGGATMLHRLPSLLLKVSMLIAVGEEHGLHQNTPLAVSHAHVHIARDIMAKWLDWAEKFLDHVGETEFETQVQRCLRVLQAEGGKMPRWKLAQKVNLPAKTLDDIELTLVDRRRIYVTLAKTNKGRPGVLWVLAQDNSDEPEAPVDTLCREART